MVTLNSTFIRYLENLVLGQTYEKDHNMPSQNMLFWRKTSFELKAFESLKALIYLKVEPSPKLNYHKSPP